MSNACVSKLMTMPLNTVSEETEDMLFHEPISNELGLSIYTKGDYCGYMILVPDNPISNDQIPEDLAGCIRNAKLNDCKWLILDADGIDA